MQLRRPQNPLSRTMLLLIVALIVVSTVLFVTGVTIERSGLGTISTHQDAGKTPTVSGDPDGGHEGSSVPQSSPKVQESGGSHSETVFGLDIENPWFVAAFVLVWLVLIAALIRFGRTALVPVILIAIAVTILDVGEIVRKASEANTVLVTFASLVTVAHVAIAVLALFVLAREYRKVAVEPIKL